MLQKSFKTNPKYKDWLFCLIFGDENEKQKPRIIVAIWHYEPKLI